MLAKTHIISTVALGTVPFGLGLVELSNELTNYYISGLLIGSLLPDIDEENSAIGRRTLFISTLINKRFGHRGATHWFITFLLLFVLTSLSIWFLETSFVFLLFGVTLGVLFHQIGDFLSGDEVNKGGIRFYFYPFGTSERIHIFPRFLRCKIGGVKEHLYLVLFTILFIYNISVIFTLQILI